MLYTNNEWFHQTSECDSINHLFPKCYVIICNMQVTITGPKIYLEKEITGYDDLNI